MFFVPILFRCCILMGFLCVSKKGKRNESRLKKFWRSPKPTSSDESTGAESPTHLKGSKLQQIQLGPAYNKPTCSLPLLQVWPSQVGWWFTTCNNTGNIAFLFFYLTNKRLFSTLLRTHHELKPIRKVSYSVCLLRNASIANVAIHQSAQMHGTRELSLANHHQIQCRCRCHVQIPPS